MCQSYQNQNKYQPTHPIAPTHREWPNRRLTAAPIWCSVDLRDGNQALTNPMPIDKKIQFFNYLVQMGFKHIEVGFPSAATVEFEFVRHIIEQGLIPQDVTIQVLTQAREHLIERTMDAIQGVPRAIVHLYNATSVAQRKYVFNKSKKDIITMARHGVQLIQTYRNANHPHILLEYSPESFTGTEIDFSVDICNQVIEDWGDPSNTIINLPATVELFMPNVYADMIEYAHQHLIHRDAITLSVHTHNDRGTGVAATELALLAGADRVEGTLFGNGERTGNLDIVTVALNLMMHGIDPTLTLHNIPESAAIYEACTGMTIPPRHPYAGDLVFTAFSGSHQDAIKKGLAAYSPETPWDVPYLAIDPLDIGRKYEAIIRINSQSGKGGVAYVLEHEWQCILPKAMQPVVAQYIQQHAESMQAEIQSETIWSLFLDEFVNRNDPIELISVRTTPLEDDRIQSNVVIKQNHQEIVVSGQGNGPIDASKNALSTSFPGIKIVSYSQHSLGQGSDSQAMCYLTVTHEGTTYHGVGMDTNITIAGVKALISSMNQFLKGGKNK